jgi:spore coat-associated protein N
MQRFAAVWHASPQKMVGVLFALLLAAMMAVGSGANFNSTSANPGNVVTAGNLKHTNTGALLTVDKIKPGETKAAGTVTIQNTGDIDGVFTVDKAVVNDSTAPANPFADRLEVKITSGATVVYDGPLNAMSAEDAGVIAPGASKTYTFAVKFLDGGTGGADNIYKAATATIRYDWEAVNN